MDHLQDNFKDGGPVSQVPASWFNRVARFINNLVPSDTVRFEKHDDGNATILEAKLGAGERGNSPVAPGHFPTNEAITQQAETLWEAGGENGADVEILFKGEYNRAHYVYAARLEITSDGRISKIVAIENGGMRISA